MRNIKPIGSVGPAVSILGYIVVILPHGQLSDESEVFGLYDSWDEAEEVVNHLQTISEDHVAYMTYPLQQGG